MTLRGSTGPRQAGDDETLPEHVSLALAAAAVAGVVDAVLRREEP